MCGQRGKITDMLDLIFSIISAGAIGMSVLAEKQDDKPINRYAPMESFEGCAHNSFLDDDIDRKLESLSIEEVYDLAKDVMAEVCFPPMSRYPIEKAIHLNGKVRGDQEVVNRIKHILMVQKGYLPCNAKCEMSFHVNRDILPYHVGRQVEPKDMNLLRWTYWELKKYDYDLDEMDEWFLFRGIDVFGVCGRNVINKMFKLGKKPSELDVRSIEKYDYLVIDAIFALQTILAIASFRVEKINKVLESGVFYVDPETLDDYARIRARVFDTGPVAIAKYARASRCIQEAVSMMPEVHLDKCGKGAKLLQKDLKKMNKAVQNTVKHYDDIIFRNKRSFFDYRGDTGQLMSDADEVLYSISWASDSSKYYSPSPLMWWKPLRNKIREIASLIGYGNGWRDVYPYR